MAASAIVIRGAREHNLKNIDLEIPRNKLVVITGLSGSGKSSLAFDTIYAEGQRRYVESLSAYARQFLEQMEKPDVDAIDGLSPAIAIEQRTASKNPRSTVATVTEIYDYLRLLFARVGKPHCYQCGKFIASQTVQQIVDQVLELPAGTPIQILAPMVRGRKGEYRKELDEVRRQGFVRVRIDGMVRELSDRIGLNKNIKHDIEVVVDRLTIRRESVRRLTESVETALRLGDGLVMIDAGNGQAQLFSERFSCIACGVSFPELAPRIFSFNNPYGACPTCGGLGVSRQLDPDLLIPDRRKSILGGAIQPWGQKIPAAVLEMLTALARRYRFSLEVPFERLGPPVQQGLLYGWDSEETGLEPVRGEGRRFSRPLLKGIVPMLEESFGRSRGRNLNEEMETYTRLYPCRDCGGARLRPESLAVRVGGLSIAEVVRLSVKEASSLFTHLTLSAQELSIARRILKEIRDRLQFLSSVGLDYLTLDRPAATLAGGEGQRIRLATQIGSGLVGVLYILDEPSIGLHQRDNRRLLQNLTRLKEMGNTVIIVEHDRDTIEASDFVVDLGPGAGVHGGEVIACGPPAAIMANPRSLTGRYLSGELSIPLPERRRPAAGKELTITRARANNLKEIDVRIPLGLFTCITGVSGSGKSTLLFDLIYRAVHWRLFHLGPRPSGFDRLIGLEYLDKVIDIDQSPIGRTPRSNPATYTGVFTLIRDLFAQVPMARARGYRAGRFSFNVKGGRCESCQGDGLIKIEMHFLPDLFITCEACRGRRFNRETLEVNYKGKSIADVLEMTVEQAQQFFENLPGLRDRLATMARVGLEYIKLGQSATTLSGGEAQRVKLSKELMRRSTGRTLYLLDEPTTGLHLADIQKLLQVLHQLRDSGNTVVVIEHHLDVIKTADYVIDLGPEGGTEGGEVVAAGTPEEVAQVARSHTGQLLKTVCHVPA